MSWIQCRKDRALMRIIELEDPDNAIIFCNTRNEVEYVAEFSNVCL